LLEEYKSLRRYFSVSVAVPYTDVWTYKPVQYYPGKHPCEKPADMLWQIINASSRPGDLVADFFMGSGSTIKAALSLGRRAIGVELEEERFNQTVTEIKNNR
ncbi:TPA: site-specific DNA-methyltransferase, partial [Escherichia coli]